MDYTAYFWKQVHEQETALLATAAQDEVTMRTVSPVATQDAILIFTHPDSTKYRQLQQNPRCCIAVGSCFAQATAVFCGSTMLEKNAALREAYTQKFADAFDESAVFGGRDSDFILLTPTRVTGWMFAPNAAPQPFECTL